MKKRRHQQVIILETCPNDTYNIHEGNPLLSGQCIYHGSIYPIFSENKKSYAVIFQRYVLTFPNQSKGEEILLASGKEIPTEPKTLSRFGAFPRKNPSKKNRKTQSSQGPNT